MLRLLLILVIALTIPVVAGVLYPKMGYLWTLRVSSYTYLRACERSNGNLIAILETMPMEAPTQPSQLMLTTLRKGAEPEVKEIGTNPPITYYYNVTLSIRSYAVNRGRPYEMSFRKNRKWQLQLRELGTSKRRALFNFSSEETPPLPITLVSNSHLIAAYYENHLIHVQVLDRLRTVAELTITPDVPLRRTSGLLLGELNGELIVAFKDLFKRRLVACTRRGCVSSEVEVPIDASLAWLGEVTSEYAVVAAKAKGELNLFSISLREAELKIWYITELKVPQESDLLGMIYSDRGLSLILREPIGNYEDQLLAISPGLRGWRKPIYYKLALPWRAIVTGSCAYRNSNSQKLLLGLVKTTDEVPKRLYILEIEPKISEASTVQ